MAVGMAAAWPLPFDSGSAVAQCCVWQFLLCGPKSVQATVEHTCPHNSAMCWLAVQCVQCHSTHPVHGMCDLCLRQHLLLGWTFHGTALCMGKYV